MSHEGPDYAAIDGWDDAFARFAGGDRPVYVGSTTCGERPLVEDAALSAMAGRKSQGQSVRFDLR